MKVDQFFLKDDKQRRDVVNVRCKHRQIMQYLILSFFRELPL